MRALVLILTCLFLAPAAASAEPKPVSLPFEDGFEGAATGWVPMDARRKLRFTEEKAWIGERSLGIYGAETWTRGAYVVLPALPNSMIYRFSVCPWNAPRRKFRAGFFRRFGRSGRFYNYVTLATKEGPTGQITFRTMPNTPPVPLGDYRAGRWITIGVHLDFEKLVAQVWVDGRSVAKGVKILPRRFDDPKHGRVALDRWGVGHRFWTPGQIGQVFVDDVRIAAWTGKPPTGEKTRGAEVDRLLELLGHENWRTRAKAVESLGRRKDRRIVPRLIAVLEGDAEPMVREGAAAALGRLREGRAFGSLLAA
ncbi:MAG: HEAT repeat domain-containing protein, partial [Planctomycetota bacterium]